MAETLLPVDGDIIPEDEVVEEMGANTRGPDDKAFMENLQQLMTLMTEECQVEFNTAMQEQNMELMSEDCKLQFSQAAGQTKGFREMQDEHLRKQANAQRLGPDPNPNTKYYVCAFLILLFAGVAGYIIYVNRKLREAGLWDQKKKPMSKKKMLKEKMKEEQRRKIK